MDEGIIDEAVNRIIGDVGDARGTPMRPAEPQDGPRALAQVLVTFYGKTEPEEEAGLYYGGVSIGVDPDLPQLTDGGDGLLEAAMSQIAQQRASIIQQGVKDAQGREIIVPAGTDAAG
jgi:hypothetical protein